MTSKIATKEKLFKTAARLFYQQGYQAVGVDTLAAEAGIGKMTLYRYYPSKDDLIEAFLQDSDKVFWDEFEQVTKDAQTAGGKLLAFFEGLQAYVQSPACYGCPFLNIAAEFPEADYVGHRVAVEHKQNVRTRFYLLAQDAGARQPRVLANALFLLMDGAYMAARTFGNSPDNPAATVAETARRLIDEQCSDS